MTIKQVNEVIMAQTKPAVFSGTLWGGLLAFLPLVVDRLPELAQEIAPILSPQSAALVAAVGGALVWVRRLFGTNKPISGILSK